LSHSGAVAVSSCFASSRVEWQGVIVSYYYGVDRARLILREAQIPRFQEFTKRNDKAAFRALYTAPKDKGMFQAQQLNSVVYQ